MSDRGAPATVVARGKIKVDARKAIAKLRDHMLVDVHLYGAELVRVAVALGATKLDIDHDADDVVFTWSGRPLHPEAVARVLDHVLAPDTAAADGDALHLLGVAVSAALGLDPSYVDVYAGTGEGQACTRVRFERRHIEAKAANEPGGDDASGGAGGVDAAAAAAAPSPVALAKPARTPGPEGPWMRVHVRRRLGLEVLGRVLRGDEAPEVALVAARAYDAPLEIAIRGEALTRGAGPVVLRVDLDEPSATRAFLEVLAPAGEVRATTAFLEHGVLLASYEGVSAWGAPSEAGLPLRVVVDARALPTNASRSEVRADAELVRRIRARVPSALEAAMEVLERVVVDGKDAASVAAATGGRITIVDARRERLEDALGALAAQVARGMRSGEKLPDSAARLLRLPLLRDALGLPMSLADVRGGTSEQPLLLYTGAQPVSGELAPWLTGLVWRRGRAVERALAELPLADGDARVEHARVAHARRARALAHPPSRPVLAASRTYVFKQSFAVDEGPFAGLAGEIAIARREGAIKRTATACVFVEERVLETIGLPAISLPVDMALAWPGRLLPRFAYDAVERGADLDRAILYALRLAAIAVGERLGKSDPELVRLAIVAWAGATRDLGDAQLGPTALGALATEPAWETTAGARVDFATLHTYVARTGALCAAPAGAGRAVDDRPVVVTEHAAMLRPLFDAKVHVVDYGRALAQRPGASDEALARAAAASPAALRFERAHVRGVVAVGPNSARVYHAGFLLRDRERTFRHGPVVVAMDDRAAVPTSSYDDCHHASRIDVQREENALLELVLERCERGELSLEAVSDYVASATRKAEARTRTARPSAREAAELLHARLVDLPLRLERERLARARALVLARPIREVARGATVSDAIGRATAALDPSPGATKTAPAPVDVLFEGHPLATLDLTDLPIVGVVDVTAEHVVRDWVDLTADGLSWAKRSLLEAATLLATELASRASFADDEAAMRLCLAVVERAPERLARIARALGHAAWPTVQGGTTRLPPVGRIRYGTRAYATYRREAIESPHDAPAVYLPGNAAGALRRRLLEAAGFSLDDVTVAVERLQSRRSRGLRAAAPTLPGGPPHPLLRSTLAALGVTSIDGEMELVAPEAAEVLEVGDDGARVPFAVALEPPVRAVFHAESVDPETVRRDLSRAADKLLRNASPHVDRLPTFVRDALRRLVCSALSSGTSDGASFAAFVDTAGRFHTLRLLSLMESVPFTRDGPPYPAPPPGSPFVLHLTEEEAAAIGSMVELEDETLRMRAELEGARRRAAAPLEELALPADLRACCIHTFRIDEEDTSGEVGLLAPAHASKRGLSLHVKMRPLAKVPDDTTGWPTVAVIDVRRVETTPAFDGLASPEELGRIQKGVRAAAGKQAPAALAAPPDALAVVRLPAPFHVAHAGKKPRGESASSTPCLGVFWLEPRWPEAPELHVEATTTTEPARAPRLARPRGGRRHALLPVRGRLYVCAEGALLERAIEEVLEWVRPRLAAGMRSAAARKAPAEEREAYAWDLALLGEWEDLDVDAELARDRPAAALVRVAARRAPHLLAQPGDRPDTETPAQAVARKAAETEAEAEAEEAAAGAADEPFVVDGGPPASSFLEGVARRVLSIVTPAAEPEKTTPLTRELMRALGALKLPGDPVTSVSEVGRGRAVRYDARARRVLVNPRSDAVRGLAESPDRTIHLVAAAVSEINRELEMVTDAEEAAVVVDLLRARSEGAAGA